MDEGRRLPPSAKWEPFVIQTSVLQDAANKWQVLAGYWKAIGVGLDYQPITDSLLQKQLQTNTLHIGSWGGGGAGEFFAHSNRPIRYEPPWHFPTLAQGGALWGIWHDTKGAKGEEPPDIIKQLFKDVDEWLQQPYGSPRYLELGREIDRINAENLWWFGIVGYDPTAWIVAKSFHNLPAADKRNPTDVCGAFGDYLPEQVWLSTASS